jgi:hypothetical protein
MLVAILFVSATALASNVSKNSILIEEKEVNKSNSNNRETMQNDGLEDLDELVDLELTFTIKEIRTLDKLDILNEADFYVKVFINGEKWFTTDVWQNKNYVNPNVSKTIDIPDNEEYVNITIQLWDKDLINDQICDIGNIFEDGSNKHDIDLFYSLKTGHWRGDDYNYNGAIYDSSGYGHANGCDDNSYKIWDGDCELFFDITQNDFDGDGIPYWTEVNVYGTDPENDDSGLDTDEDGIPIEWEHKWGHYFLKDEYSQTYEHHWIYDPFVWDDHYSLNPDQDGLQNYEEYLTSVWGSDPFRRDIFIELDQMKVEDDKGSYVPQLAKEWLRDAFAKQNIVIHIDDHEEDSMNGGEIIPFMEKVPRGGHINIYNDYFLHNGLYKWRQGIFHYAVVVYRLTGAAGFAFWCGDQSYPYSDGIIIATRYHDNMSKRTLKNILNTQVLDDDLRKAKVYASVLMHETGHVLGINRWNTGGCDNRKTYTPKQVGWWRYRNYRSCMNYRYLFEILDYSDGSHGRWDYDDWSRIDLRRFQGKYTTDISNTKTG